MATFGSRNVARRSEMITEPSALAGTSRQSTAEYGVAGGGPVVQPSIIGDIGGWILKTGGEIIEEEARRRLAGGGGGNGGNGGAGGFQSQECPPGYNRFPGTQTCIKPSAALPGGEPLTVPDEGYAYGEAVMDGFGNAAIEPAIVGQRLDARGIARPIRKCPPGTVLGKNNLCYNGTPPGGRKWKKTRCPVSAYDMKMMRKYGPGGSKQKKIKKLAQNAGLKATKK